MRWIRQVIENVAVIGNQISLEGAYLVEGVQWVNTDMAANMQSIYVRTRHGDMKEI